MSLGTRLNNALARALLLSEGGTVDLTRDTVSLGRGGHGTHGERGRAPGGTSRSMVEQWVGRFEHLLLALERDIESVERGVEPIEWRGTKPAMGLRRRIHEYAGRDPVFVAFVERCSVQLVHKVRKEAGLHTTTGDALTRNERPLTAHPRHTLAQITEEVG